MFSVMTLAATGSEMNACGVVTYDEIREKYAIRSLHLYPKASVINPELMATVTPDYLAYSDVDIFAHYLDQYFSAGYLPEYNAALIENILQTVVRTTAVSAEDQSDPGQMAIYDDRFLPGLQVVRNGLADYISLSRPLICEPGLIKRWREGDRRKSECVSDNACFGPASDGRGLYCVTMANKRSKAKNK